MVDTEDKYAVLCRVVFSDTKTPHPICQKILNGIDLANQYCSENRFDAFSGQLGAMSINYKIL